MILKKSFTLSEIMIAMAVLGIIVAASVPIILNMSPNKNAIMLKKAYYTTQQIVSDLINNDILYPNGDFHEDNSLGTGEDISEFAKFSCLFARKMNIDGSKLPTVDDFCKRTENEHANFILYTQDGMAWNFVGCKFGEDETCRIDVSSVSDLTKVTYSNSVKCIYGGDGWGGNYCTEPGTHEIVKPKLGKAAFFISKDGGISLKHGNDVEQPEVQAIIDGTTSLIGKGK